MLAGDGPSPAAYACVYAAREDTVARQTMARSGASEQDSDIYFGWNENMYSQRMQLHYESNFTRERRCCRA